MKKWTLNASLLSVIAICIGVFAVWKTRAANQTEIPSVTYQPPPMVDASTLVANDLGAVALTANPLAAPELPQLLKLRKNQIFRITGRLADPNSWKPDRVFVSIEIFRHDDRKGDVIHGNGVALLNFDPKDPSKVTFQCESPAPHQIGPYKLRVRCGSDQFILRGQVIVSE